MLSSKNIFDGEINFDNPRFLTEDDFRLENRRTDVSVNDILLTIVGTVGRVAVVTELHPKFTLQRSVAVLKPVLEKVDSRFLMYTLRNMLDVLLAGARGVAQKGIYLKQIRDIEIPLPPLPEQKRIAAILDKTDAIRRKRQQAIQLADDFLRAVFLDMFGDPVTNPKGWETFTLADVVRKDSIITYGIVQAGEHVDGGVPYIRTGDFKDGRLVRSGYARTSTDIASKFKRSEVAPGDIVYCIRASVGSADVVPEFLAGANLTQGTAKISPAHDMKAEFLVELLRSAGFRSWIDKNSKGATFKEITLARLREAPVFKPPMFEQETFIRIKKIVMERLAGKFQEADVPLFESLSQKAFSGQL